MGVMGVMGIMGYSLISHCSHYSHSSHYSYYSYYSYCALTLPNPPFKKSPKLFDFSKYVFIFVPTIHFRQIMKVANYHSINNLFGEVKKFTPPCAYILR